MFTVILKYCNLFWLSINRNMNTILYRKKFNATILTASAKCFKENTTLEECFQLGVLKLVLVK